MKSERGGATQHSLPPEAPARLYGVVLGIGVVCSLAIVSTYELTRPIIMRNKIEQRRRAITEVITEARSVAAFQYQRDTDQFVHVDENAQGDVLYAGFSSSDELVGVALSASGTGYQDTIRLLYGYDPNVEEIIGIRILDSRETPGLGDRIETDQAFLQNFAHLDVRVNSESDALQHPIEFVEQGGKSSAWEIDGITGATISSRAVAEMLQRSANAWVPTIVRRRSDFTVPSSGSER